MRTIRASEIGTYLYCRRAWWYQARGETSQNQAEMAGGSAYHYRHGRKVVQAGLARLVGWLLLVAALILLAVALTLQWVG